jgi:hypothetical protein
LLQRAPFIRCRYGERTTTHHVAIWLLLDPAELSLGLDNRVVVHLKRLVVSLHLRVDRHVAIRSLIVRPLPDGVSTDVTSARCCDVCGVERQRAK